MLTSPGHPVTTPKPTWSLTGAVIDNKSGPPTTVRQSAWTFTPDGWVSMVTLNAASGDSVAGFTAQLLVTHSLPEAIAPELAKTLIALRLRSAAADLPSHLGNIYVR